jgi:hypothetical protein
MYGQYIYGLVTYQHPSESSGREKVVQYSLDIFRKYVCPEILAAFMHTHQIQARKDKGICDMAGFHCQVYHNALAKVFESLQVPARYGTPLRCGDGVVREFVPVLASGSADYMELCIWKSVQI